MSCRRMPFKIVSTQRRGRAELCTLPSHWESTAKLKWPKFNADYLCKNENAQPSPDWISMNCTLKRNNFTTFEDAEEELSNMTLCVDHSVYNTSSLEFASSSLKF